MYVHLHIFMKHEPSYQTYVLLYHLKPTLVGNKSYILLCLDSTATRAHHDLSLFSQSRGFQMLSDFLLDE